MRSTNAARGIGDRISQGWRAAPRRLLAAAGLGAALLLFEGSGVQVIEPRAAQAETRPHQACEGWDASARRALAQLIHDRSDAAARRLGDGLFRLRRARRNCTAGWIVMACGDYRAILRGAGEAPAAAFRSAGWLPRISPS